MNKDDDMWLPENWAKANPLNLWSDDLNMDQEKIKRMAEKALEAKEKGDTELLNFMTKSLNIWDDFIGWFIVGHCEMETV